MMGMKLIYVYMPLFIKQYQFSVAIIMHLFVNQNLIFLETLELQGAIAPKLYRVTIKERYKVRLHCDPIKSPGEFLSLLEAHQIWSI